MSLTKSLSCWAFDIDGVLADTRQAVTLAYKRAGVELPEEAWGISWKVWLPAIVGPDAAQGIHLEKQRHYETLLDAGMVHELPGAHLARALIWLGHPVRFVTAASERSARAVLRSLNLPTDYLYGSELSPSARAEKLREIAKHFQGVTAFTYFDDREEGAQIAADAGWVFAHARWTQ
jgi:hypothetical protein